MHTCFGLEVDIYAKPVDPELADKPVYMPIHIHRIELRTFAQIHDAHHRISSIRCKTKVGSVYPTAGCRNSGTVKAVTSDPDILSFQACAIPKKSLEFNLFSIAQTWV